MIKTTKKIIKAGKFFKKGSKIISLKNLVQGLKIATDNRYYFDGVQLSDILIHEINKKLVDKFPTFSKKYNTWIYKGTKLSDVSENPDFTAQFQVINAIKNVVSKNKKEINNFYISPKDIDLLDIDFESLPSVIYTKFIDLGYDNNKVKEILKEKNILFSVKYFIVKQEDEKKLDDLFEFFDDVETLPEKIKQLGGKIHNETFYVTTINSYSYDRNIGDVLRSRMDMLYAILYAKHGLSHSGDKIFLRSVNAYTIDKFKKLDILSVKNKKLKTKKLNKIRKSIAKSGFTQKEIFDVENNTKKKVKIKNKNKR